MKRITALIVHFTGREINKYKKSEFFKNVLKLFSGNIAAQCITLLTAPIITRLYPPESYGMFGLFITISGVAGSLVCLQYNRAIVLCKKDEDAINVSFICLMLCLTFTLAIISTLVFFNKSIIKLFDINKSLLWLYFVPIIVLANGIFLTIQALNVRDKFFGEISKSRILDAFSGKICTIVVALSGSVGPIGLILGTVTGNVIRTYYLLKHTFGFFIKNIHYISINRSFILAKHHRKFPFFLSWAGLLFTLNEAIPIWMITYYFSVEYAGYYTLVRGVLLKPSQFLAEAISQPYYQKIATHKDDKALAHKVTQRLIKRLLPATILMYGTIAIIAPSIFPAIFGENWLVAGKIVQILALFMGTRFFIKSISMFFSAFELQYIEFILQLALFFSVLLSFVLFANFFSFLVVLISSFRLGSCIEPFPFSLFSILFVGVCHLHV